MASIHRAFRTPGDTVTAPIFHGKEGVVGSNPTEGFIEIPAQSGDISFPGQSFNYDSADPWVPCGSLRVHRDPRERPLLRARTRGCSGVSDDLGAAAFAALLMPESRRTPFDDLDPLSVLTTAEIASRLEVDPRSVRRAIERGDLPASRACGVRVLAADAADWWRASAVRRRESPPRGTETAPMSASQRSRRPARTATLSLPPRGGSR